MQDRTQQVYTVSLNTSHVSVCNSRSIFCTRLMHFSPPAFPGTVTRRAKCSSSCSCFVGLSFHFTGTSYTRLLLSPCALNPGYASLLCPAAIVAAPGGRTLAEYRRQRRAPHEQLHSHPSVDLWLLVQLPTVELFNPSQPLNVPPLLLIHTPL